MKRGLKGTAAILTRRPGKCDARITPMKRGLKVEGDHMTDNAFRAMQGLPR